jgi:hypothetical protein
MTKANELKIITDAVKKLGSERVSWLMQYNESQAAKIIAEADRKINNPPLNLNDALEREIYANHSITL